MFDVCSWDYVLFGQNKKGQQQLFRSSHVTAHELRGAFQNMNSDVLSIIGQYVEAGPFETMLEFATPWAFVREAVSPAIFYDGCSVYGGDEAAWKQRTLDVQCIALKHHHAKNKKRRRRPFSDDY